jgi:DNA anti-recombination protein RmuC
MTMWKLLRILKNASEVLTTVGAVLAAAIVVVETYQALRKKIEATKGS